MRLAKVSLDQLERKLDAKGVGCRMVVFLVAGEPASDILDLIMYGERREVNAAPMTQVLDEPCDFICVDGRVVAPQNHYVVCLDGKLRIFWNAQLFAAL